MLTLLILLHIYFVSFVDKPEKSAAALSPRALAQRAQWNIPIDGMDYPVSTMYQNQLKKQGAKIHHVSRWFNGVTCEMNEMTATKVAQLSFVTNVEMTRDNSAPIYGPKKRMKEIMANGDRITANGNYTDDQLDLYNLRALHQAGFEGQGILMAICDGGFYMANTMSCFRQDTLELGHFDFTDDTDGFYGSTGAHGTECLSTISGIANGYYGAATQAKYYLMRAEETEHESPKEMDNVVAALETADSLGANIFSISLGYMYFDNDAWSLSKTDLNGKSTRSSLAATVAARKGMLVCVSAGNEGYDPVNSLSSPADADSILTVGAVGTDSIIGSFSSWGPSSDGRIKPDVCAVGDQAALIYPPGTIVYNNGTSFATPLIAGLAASLWSALPTENAMQIRERILRSSNRYLNPDTHQYGYGIPNAWLAYTNGDLSGMSDERVVEKPKKVLRNGQIMLIYEGHIYDVLGRLIK